MPRKTKARETAPAEPRYVPTDEAIMQMIAAGNGEVMRRDLARKLGHRADFGSTLMRLKRRDRIELLTKETHNNRVIAIVRARIYGARP